MEVNEARILRFPQVVQKTGLSRSSVYGRIKSGEFPTPIQLGTGRAIGFLEQEIADWVEAMARGRNHVRSADVEFTARGKQ